MIYHSSTRFKFLEKLNRKYFLFLLKLINIVLQDATYRNFRNYTENICTIRAFPKKKKNQERRKNCYLGICCQDWLRPCFLAVRNRLRRRYSCGGNPSTNWCSAPLEEVPSGSFCAPSSARKTCSSGWPARNSVRKPIKAPSKRRRG